MISVYYWNIRKYNDQLLTLYIYIKNIIIKFFRKDIIIQNVR